EMLDTFGIHLSPEDKEEFQKLSHSNHPFEREASEEVAKLAQKDLATERERGWHMELVTIRCSRNAKWVENVRRMEEILFKKPSE
ncbi:MAG: hypothetical protein P1Q69_20890, partial [Candidatus Thorarchaeota archaeon]|nr:hypothetical protein [Candidatus Thorarchaeota archaeon]